MSLRLGRLIGGVTAFFMVLPLAHATSGMWGTNADLPVFLSVGVQSTLPANVMFEVLRPTIEHLQQTLPHARISFERMSSADLYDAVRLQNIHAFVADAGLFADLQSHGWAEQLAAHQPSFATDPAFVMGMAVVVPKDSVITTVKALQGHQLLSDSPDNFGTWLLFERLLVQESLSTNDFLKKTTFNGYIAPMPLERLARGDGEAAILPMCELERAIEMGTVKAGNFRVLDSKTFMSGGCQRTGALYPGVVFGISAHVSGEAAKALTQVLLSMQPLKNVGEWSVVTDFGTVKNVYRELKRGPYAYLRANPWQAFWEKWRAWFAGAVLILLGWLAYTVHVKTLVNKRTKALTKALHEKELKDAEARSAREQLGALERAGVVSELSSMFAHEVRQPVSATVSYAGALRLYAEQQYPDDPIIPKTARKIESTAVRVSDIVERVRSYARGRRHPRQRMQLHDVVQMGVDYFVHGSLADGIRVDLHLDDDPWVEVEPLELSLVVLNLLRNGAQAMAEASVENRWIQVAAQCATFEEGKVVRLVVADHGPGFSEEALKSLLQKGPSQSTTPGGLGLGLMIVRTVIESHGGRLTFRNGDAGGIAEITLPVVEVK